jgi:hypothetical protein
LTDDHCSRLSELSHALCLATQRALSLPIQDRQLFLETDASKLGCAAILLQQHDNQLTPLGFFSRAFSRAEQNSSTTTQEFLALAHGLQHFQRTIRASPLPVIIITDHRSLLFWRTMSTETSTKLARLLSFLAILRFSVQYRKGSLNVAADFLSIARFLQNTSTKGSTRCRNNSVQP